MVRSFLLASSFFVAVIRFDFASSSNANLYRKVVVQVEQTKEEEASVDA